MMTPELRYNPDTLTLSRRGKAAAAPHALVHQSEPAGAPEASSASAKARPVLPVALSRALEPLALPDKVLNRLWKNSARDLYFRLWHDLRQPGREKERRAAELILASKVGNKFEEPPAERESVLWYRKVYADKPLDELRSTVSSLRSIPKELL